MSSSASVITPKEASHFAEAVYGVMNLPSALGSLSPVTVGFGRGLSNHGLASDWDLDAGKVFKGVSGFNGVETGFAAAVPKKAGKGNEVVVTVRGTQGAMGRSPDWQTNSLFASAFGPTGGQVHKGFLSVADSFYDPLARYLGGIANAKNGIVHLTGHSLGGAIASLLAAKLKTAGYQSIRLYTFGAPRIGLESFSRGIGGMIKNENIYRVFHHADPVPMFPLYPYVHAPLQENGIAIGESTGKIWPSYHDMKEVYIPKVDTHQWEALRTSSASIVSLRRVDYWLDRAAEAVRVPGGALGLSMLGKALQALIDFAGKGIGLVAFTAATVVDRLVMLFMRAKETFESIIPEFLESLLSSILKWAGHYVLVPTISLTANFLKFALGLLIRPLVAVVQLAFDIGTRQRPS